MNISLRFRSETTCSPLEREQKTLSTISMLVLEEETQGMALPVAAPGRAGGEAAPAFRSVPRSDFHSRTVLDLSCDVRGLEHRVTSWFEPLNVPDHGENCEAACRNSKSAGQEAAVQRSAHCRDRSG